jgi:UDP-glucuronate 4-epimerase
MSAPSLQPGHASSYTTVAATTSSAECSHLSIASTRSVYGANPRQPFEEDDSTDRPLSLHAATKKAAEVTAYNYLDWFGLPTTVMRLFTV